MITHNSEASIHRWKISVSYREKTLSRTLPKETVFISKKKPNLDFELSFNPIHILLVKYG